LIHFEEEKVTTYKRSPKLYSDQLEWQLLEKALQQYNQSVPTFKFLVV